MQRTPSGAVDTQQGKREASRVAREPAVAQGARQPASVAVVDRPEGARALNKAERSVLSVLAQYPDGLPKGPLAILAGYSYSGGFRNTLSALRTSGHIVGGNEQVMAVTDAGLGALGDYEPLPMGRDLLNYWLADARLGAAEKKILAYLADRYPDSIAGEELRAARGPRVQRRLPQQPLEAPDARAHRGVEHDRRRGERGVLLMADGIRVTALDLKTGDTETTEIEPGNYVLVCAEPAYIAHTTAHASGTHVLTVKGYVSRARYEREQAAAGEEAHL